MSQGNQIKERLPKGAKEADELFRLAEAKFSSGDFPGCIQCLFDNFRTLRKKQAAELRQRVLEKIREGKRAAPSTNEARQLAARLFRSVEDLYIEGTGGIDWAEHIIDGLDEVLYLFPQFSEAIKMREEFAAALPKYRE